MTLTERIAARLCKVEGCQRERHPDAAVCGAHLTDLWRNRLDRQPDGSFVARRRFTARDMTRNAA